MDMDKVQKWLQFCGEHVKSGKLIAKIYPVVYNHN